MASPDIFQSLFEYVADNPQPEKRKNEKAVDRQTPPEEVATRFLRQFGIKELAKALKDGKTSLSLSWYVQELLNLYRDENSTSPTKLEVLKEIKFLLAMGAIQQPEVVSALSDGPKRKKQDQSGNENDVFLRLVNERKSKSG